MDGKWNKSLHEPFEGNRSIVFSSYYDTHTRTHCMYINLYFEAHLIQIVQTFSEIKDVFFYFIVASSLMADWIIQLHTYNCLFYFLNVSVSEKEPLFPETNTRSEFILYSP